MTLLHYYNKKTDLTTVLVFTDNTIVLLVKVTGRLNKYNIISILSQLELSGMYSGYSLLLPTTLANAKQIQSLSKVYNVTLKGYSFNKNLNITQSIRTLMDAKFLWVEADISQENIIRLKTILNRAQEFEAKLAEANIDPFVTPEQSSQTSGSSQSSQPNNED
jgi:hypothetical protein